MEIVDFDGDGIAIDSVSATGGLVDVALLNGDTRDCASGMLYELTFDTDGAYEGLALGEDAVVVVTVVIDDGRGGLIAREVQITVTGENDAPTLDAVTLAAEETGGPVSVDLADYGDDIDSDDDGTTLIYTITAPPAEGAATVSGTQVTFDPTGFFTDLGQGETRDVTFEVTATDRHGATAVNTVTVTVTGTNDAPQVTVSPSAGFTEAPVAGVQVLADSGTVDFTDSDAGDLVDITFVSNGDIAWSGGVLDPGIAAALEAGFSTGVSDAVPPGSIGWNYAAQAALSFLAIGEEITWSYTITATDLAGETGTQVLSFTVTGRNNAPQITSAPVDVALAEPLAPGGLSDQGQITFADLDATDTASIGHLPFTVIFEDAAGAGVPSPFTAAEMAALEAAVTIDETGYWRLDIPASLGIDRLSAGDTLRIETRVFATDDSGAPNDTSGMQVFRVAVTGRNDLPEITAAVVEGAVSEIADGAPGESVDVLSASGTIDFTDIDAFDTHTATALPVSTGYVGSFSVPAGPMSGSFDWTFTVDDAALDSLGEGETLQQVYEVILSDDNGGSATRLVTVTITGSNDGPEIAVGQDTSGAVREAGSDADGIVVDPGTPVATGTLAGFDPDAGAVLTWSGDTAGTYGDFSIDPGTGAWTYALNNGAADSLSAGQVETESFVVTLTDDAGASTTASITISVTGTNDAPSASALSGVVQESAVTEKSPSATLENIAAQNIGLFIVFDFDNNVAFSVPRDLSSNNTVSQVAESNLAFGNGVVVVVDPNSNSWRVSASLFSKGELSYIETSNYSIIDTDGGTPSATIGSNFETLLFSPDNETVEEIKISLLNHSLVDERILNFEAQILGIDYRISRNDDLLISEVKFDAQIIHPKDRIVINAAFTDVDALDSHTFGVDTTGTLGLVTNNLDGTFTYSANGAFEHLAIGQQATDTFTYTVDDGNGGVDTEVVTITVEGANDAPRITLTTPDTDAETLAETGVPLTVSSSLTFSDVDISDTVTAAVTGFSASGATAVLAGIPSADLLGMLTLDTPNVLSGVESLARRGWTFDSGTTNFAGLSLGESLVLTYTVTATDVHGAEASHDIAITIEGRNNRPTVVIEPALPFVEDADATAQVLSQSGTLSFDDIDLGDTIDLTYSINGAPVWSGGTLTAAQETALAAGFSTGVTGANAPGTIGWTYDATLDLDFLGRNETIGLSYMVAAHDGTQTGTDVIFFSILGTNDAPVVTATPASAITEEADASAQVIGLSGTVEIADLDVNDVLEVYTQLVDVPVWSHGTLTAAQEVQIQTGFTLGVPGPVTAGTVLPWSYNNSLDLDFLGAGETITFSVRIVANDFGAALASDIVTFTITGTNDGPVLVADGNGSDLVTEAGTLDPGDPSAVGKLLINDSDPDANDTLTLSAVNGSAANIGTAVAGTYGSLLVDAAGNWTYTLDDADPDTEALAQGEIATEVFGYSVVDSTGAEASSTLTITITGSGDNAPPVASDDSLQVDEDDVHGFAQADIFGQVSLALANDTDPEGDALRASSITNGIDSEALPDPFGAPGQTMTIAGTNGGVFTVRNDGAYSFDTNGEFNALAHGEFVSTGITYTVTDANGGTDTAEITVDVRGRNDAPVAVADDNGGNPVVEAGFATAGDPSASGNVLANDTDPDTSDVLIVLSVEADNANVGAPVAGLYGSVVIGANGDWTYTLDDLNPSTRALAEGEVVTETFQYVVNDGLFAADTGTLTITITGSNDAPFAPDTLQVGTEDGMVIDSVLSSDPDSVAAPIHTVETGPSHGSVTMNIDGSFTYIPDADWSGIDSFDYRATDSLGAYEVGTEIITIEAVADAPTVSLAPPGAATYGFAGSGVDQQVSTAATDGDTAETVAALDGGGYVVVWHSNENGTYNVLARMFSDDGTPQGQALTVASGLPAIPYPVVNGLPGGGFAIAHASAGAGGSDISVSLYDTGGSQTNTQTFGGSGLVHPDTAVLDDGRIVVTYTQSAGGDAGSSAIMGQVLASNGNLLGSPFLVNVTNPTAQQSSHVTALPGGGFVAVWASDLQDGNGLAIVGRMFDASAAPVGPEFVANTYTNGNQELPVVAALADGGYVVAWQSFGQDGSGNSLHAQRYDLTGARVGGEFQVNTYSFSAQSSPTVVGLPDGGFAISWSSFLEDGSGYGIFEQRYNADGSPFGIETRVNNITTGNQYSYPFGGGGQMALLDNGDLVNVWSTEIGAGEIFSTLTSLPEGYTTEDRPVPVNLAAALTDTDGSETLTITLSGFPAGATFSLGAASGSDWVIENAEGLDLSTLEMTPPADWNGSFTLTAMATATETSNGSAASTTASGTYRILPVEDGPRAENQVIEVPINDGLSPYTPPPGALVAVDPDLGDTLTWTAGSFALPNGTLNISPSGGFNFIPNPGFTGVETFTATVTDSTGRTDTAELRIEVANETFVSDSGQEVTLDLNAAPVDGNPAGAISIDLTSYDAPSVNLVFAMDASGSLGASAWLQQLDAVSNALEDIATRFDGTGIDIDVEVFSYSGATSQNNLRLQFVDGNPATLPQILTAPRRAAPSVDLDLTTLAGLQADIAQMTYTAGFTPWDAAFQQTEYYFDSQYVVDGPDALNLMLFITDGNPGPTQQWAQPLANLLNDSFTTTISSSGTPAGTYTPQPQFSLPYAVDVQSFGIGSNLNLALLSQTDSDGQATPVTSFGALSAALTGAGLFPATLIALDVTLEADGTDLGTIADETNPAVVAGTLEIDLALADLAGIEDLLGAQNEFAVTAIFDLDGDTGTTFDQVTLNSYELIGLGDTAVTETGTSGNDLLMGSLAGDSIDGEAGDDLILTGAGSDTVIGGTGDDRLGGGADGDSFVFRAGDGLDRILDYDALRTRSSSTGWPSAT
ncbi:MAG: VCBS domain-containing protein [Sagittula sp.]